MILRMAWYSPDVMGSVWASKQSKKVAANYMARGGPMFSSTIGAFVSALVLQVTLKKFGAKTILDGMGIAAFLWFGFVVARQGPHAMFEGQDPTVFAIHVIYDLLSMVITGGVIGYAEGRSQQTGTAAPKVARKGQMWAPTLPPKKEK